MSLFGGGSNSTHESRIGNLKFQSSGFGVCVQLCWGTNRIYTNLIDRLEFNAVQHQESSSGGKGFGDTPANTYWTYSATLIFAVCAGDIRGYGRLWKDKDVRPTTAEISAGKTGLSALGFTGFKGNGLVGSSQTEQSAWSYLSGKTDVTLKAHAKTYRHLAYIAAENYQLGRDATVGTHSIEVFGLGLNSDPTAQNYLDAHVKDIIIDYLDRCYFPSDKIADLTLLDNYCRANDLLISPLLDTQKPAHQWLDDFVFIANAGLYWSEGKLHIKPYSDHVAENSFATYTPDLTIAAELTENDVSDIRPVFKSKTDCFNHITIDHISRQQSYNKIPTIAKDSADIASFGLRKKDPRTLEAIKTVAVAAKVAANDLQRELCIRYGYEIDVSIDFDYLECMDYIRLSNTRLGIDSGRYRIIAITDDNSSDNALLTLTIEEAPEGIYRGSDHSGINGTSTASTISDVPANINEPIIFIAPSKLSVAGGEIWAGISNSDPLYGGCDVYLSYDGSSYKKIATHTKNAITGQLTADFSNNASVLSIDVSESTATIDGFTQTAFDLYDSLCRVGNELIAFRDASLTGTYHYDLRVFHRSLYGTSAGAATDNRFLLCDDRLLKLWFKENLAGTTIYLKFQCFNYFGNGYQKLSDLTAYEFIIDNAGRISQTIIEVVDP